MKMNNSELPKVKPVQKMRANKVISYFRNQNKIKKTKLTMSQFVSIVVEDQIRIHLVQKRFSLQSSYM